MGGLLGVVAGQLWVSGELCCLTEKGAVVNVMGIEALIPETMAGRIGGVALAVVIVWRRSSLQTCATRSRSSMAFW